MMSLMLPAAGAGFYRLLEGNQKGEAAWRKKTLSKNGIRKTVCKQCSFAAPCAKQRFSAHAAGKKRKPCLRKILAFWILMAVLGGAGGWIYQTWQKIPSSIRIRAGEEQELFLDVPVSGTIYGEKTAQKDVIPVNLNRPLTVQASQIQDYTMDVKLFGIVPFKQVDVHVVEGQRLIPAGVPVGIYIKTEGILVIAESDFEGLDHSRKEPSRYLLRAGDYILKVDGVELEGKSSSLSKWQRRRERSCV